jgi:hypothetical protein
MFNLSAARLLSLGGAVAFMAACAGESSDPLAPSLDVGIQVAGEGQLAICKAGNSTGNFDFTWSIDLLAGGNFSSGQVTGLAVGDCVVATTLPTLGSGRYLATVTEAAPPLDWSLTNVGVTYSSLTTLPATWPTPSINLATGVVSNVGMANDVGAEITFTNTYIPPLTGCTYTQGYWKTHSAYGPAPTDPTWALLANGPDTPFFLSNQTWYEVFHTAPAGNAYYTLAHQYMAAQLSILDGADGTAVASALGSADALFAAWTPAQVAALRGNNATRAQFLSLAGTLGSYNEGTTGPGHCGG